MIFEWTPAIIKPKKNGQYLVSYEDAVDVLDYFNGKWFFPVNGNGCIAHEETGPIEAWAEFPPVYEPDEKNRAVDCPWR